MFNTDQSQLGKPLIYDLELFNTIRRFIEDNLDLVEEKSGGGNIKLYGLTPFGRKILESIEM